MEASSAINIDGYERAASSNFRLSRFSIFVDIVRSIPTSDRPLRILDIGGVEAYWTDKRHLIDRRTEITLINLEGGRASTEGFVFRRGNACHMPEFADNSFDVIHSNSVIE